MKKLLLIVGLIGVMVIGGIGLKIAWERSAEKARLEKQAVWIARYLSVSTFDLAGALRELQTERPNEKVEPAIWEQIVASAEGVSAETVIVVCKRTHGGRQLVIRRDQFIEWTSAPAEH